MPRFCESRCVLNPLMSLIIEHSLSFNGIAILFQSWMCVKHWSSTFLIAYYQLPITDFCRKTAILPIETWYLNLQFSFKSIKTKTLILKVDLKEIKFILCINSDCEFRIWFEEIIYSWCHACLIHILNQE